MPAEPACQICVPSKDHGVFGSPTSVAGTDGFRLIAAVDICLPDRQFLPKADVWPWLELFFEPIWGGTKEIFQDLVECATHHFDNTGRYLQVWGELGEIYAEIKFGLRRHATHAPGSDGTIDGKRVEVKTISPEKTSDHVLVKTQGNFEKLLIVRIDREFQFQGKLIDRSELSGGAGKYLKARLP